MNEQDSINMQDIRQMRLAQELGMNPEYGDNIRERPEEKFLEQLNPRFLCQEFENGLKGKEWDQESEKWTVVPGMKRELSINDNGIAEIMKIIRSKVNTNTVYSNLPEEIIETITIDAGIRISRLLSLKYKDYQMEIIDINMITNDACDFIYTALRRGNDALTLRLLRTMIQSKELTTNQPDKKKGIPNPLDMFRRNK
jgi:hypothetical protein